jgi:transposase
MIRREPEKTAKLICDLNVAVDSLQKALVERDKVIARLMKNSSNSSKPPSSDITKPKDGSAGKGKKKGKRKIGAQPGHPRHERPPFAEEQIDKVCDYILARCPNCDAEDVRLLDGPPNVIQQVELKEITVTRHEHRSHPVWCEHCGQVHYMQFPPEVVRAGLFKERISALVAYMKHVCHASFSTIRKFVRDILGERISRGYLVKVIQKVSRSLDRPYAELLDRIPLETVVNVDETGHKENAKRFWTWVFKAELYVLFKIDKSRGSKVLIEVLGEQFQGVIGCDYFSAYRKYMRDFHVAIQFCLAHLIRDIRFLTTLPDPVTRNYGKKLLAAIKEMFRTIHDRDTMAKASFESALENSRRHIMRIGIDDAPSRFGKDGKQQKREAQNMATRFRDHGQEYFRFITTPSIDPTNNVAERAIRFVVIDRHVTQGTRGARGRQANERLWTVIATCELQGRSAFDFILQCVSAHFRDHPPPSLLPAPT